MYFLFGLIYLSSKKQSWIKAFLFIILAGLTGKVFHLWYPKSELILISFCSLLFFLIINTRDWKKVFLIAFIYILLTNPQLYLDSLKTILNNPYLSGYMSANVLITDLINTTSLNFNN